MNYQKQKLMKEHKKADYTIMFMNGTLNAHLKEIQEIAQNFDRKYEKYRYAILGWNNKVY